ncbi:MULTISPECIES: transposase domain-containing protein [Sphingobium]|nr:transposase domain-containing protein [Sphingobium sp. 15-1]
MSAVAIEILAARQVNAQPPSIPSIETAKLNGLEPQACIADVIEKIAGA